MDGIRMDSGTDAHERYTEAYIGILNTYNEQITGSVEYKNKLKIDFFKLIKRIMMILIILFVLSVVASFAVFILMIKWQYSSVAVITGAITGMLSTFATIVLSIFKLPKIIAEYLFNKEEDAQMNKVIRNIQKYELDAVRLEKTAVADAEKEKAGGQKSDLLLEVFSNDGRIQPESLEGQDNESRLLTFPPMLRHRGFFMQKYWLSSTI